MRNRWKNRRLRAAGFCLLLGLVLVFGVPGLPEPAGCLQAEAGETDQNAAWQAAVLQAMKEYRALAIANWDTLTLAQKVMGTQTAQQTDEILLVVGNRLTLWQQQPDLTWAETCEAACGYGANGLSLDKREGDRKTPIGSFPILYAFGTAANPGTTMQYVPVTPYSYWSEEKDTYNTWVESRTPIKGEHLSSYYQYKYAMAIGYNYFPPVYNRGSAIFLHCKSAGHWYTSGCIAVREADMVKLLQLTHDGAYIILVPDEESLKNY